MRHHFADFLDREDGYWTVVPNRERYAYGIDAIPPASPDATIVTIGKNDEHWARALELPNLEELTLHEPSKEQLAAIGALSQLKRLRITHASPRNIDFIAGMTSVEELVLEYVSGFSDLAPLQSLTRLRALHIENLRRVSDFGGLSGLSSLAFLLIDGTLDWNQPINDFAFLQGLQGLEVLALHSVTCKAAYPALMPALQLPRLKKLRIASHLFAAEEYALLEEALPHVHGTSWGPYKRFAYAQVSLAPDDPRATMPLDELRAQHPEVTVVYDGRREVADPANEWFLLTGKGAGRVKCTSKDADAKCRAYAERYAAMKQAARALLPAASAG